MPAKVCVMTSAHPAFDVRIFHKECRSLAKAGYEVSLVVPHPVSQQIDGVKIVAVPKRPGRFQRVLKTTLAIFGTARAQNADVYHFHDPELIPVALLLRFLGKMVVYDVHEDLPRTLSYKPYIPRRLKYPLELVVEIAENLAARWFSGLIAATPEIANRFRKYHRRVSIVQNYPMLEEFEEPTETTPAQERTAYLTYVGARITRARGAQEMVRALELLTECPQLRLKLAGSIDSKGLLSELSEMPGWERCDYLGTLGRREIADLIHGAFAGLTVLHPEKNYMVAHPVKLFEYMCAGIPVVVSDFPVFRSIVEGANCGLLVNPLDAKEIAAAIHYLWTHPDEAKRMGESGRCAVQSRYNWQNEERKLLDLYVQLSGEWAFRSSLGVERS